MVLQASLECTFRQLSNADYVSTLLLISDLKLRVRKTWLHTQPTVALWAEQWPLDSTTPLITNDIHAPNYAYSAFITAFKCTLCRCSQHKLADWTKKNETRDANVSCTHVLRGSTLLLKLKVYKVESMERFCQTKMHLLRGKIAWLAELEVIDPLGNQVHNLRIWSQTR